jgi:hypothetical protein
MPGSYLPGIIVFSHNWNNKLNNDALTTIRLRNDAKYQIGHEYYINLKENNRNTNKGLYRCASLAHFRISQLNIFMAYIDTGLPPDKAKNLIQCFYKNYNPPIDWNTQELSFILLVKKK